MRPENTMMQSFLNANGINAIPKYIATGSMKQSWRLYGLNAVKKNGHGQALVDYQKWTPELAEKLNALGFTNIFGKPLGLYDGNGGAFSVFVKGHNEFL